MHTRLQQQLAKHFPTLPDFPTAWLDFLAEVSEAYTQADAEQQQLSQVSDVISQGGITISERKTQNTRHTRTKRHTLAGSFSSQTAKSEPFTLTDQNITTLRQIENELIGQKELFENLVTVARAAIDQPDLESTLQNILDVATWLTGAERGSLFLLNQQGQVTQCIITHDPAAALLMQDPALFERSIAGSVARQGQAALIADTFTDKRWLTLSDDPHIIRSVLCLPILSNASVLGILTLLHADPDYFNEKHLRLLEAAADQLALALRNAQIYETQRQMARRQFTLYEVLRLVGTHLSPQRVITSAIAVIDDLTDWNNILLAVPLPEGREWEIQVASGKLIAHIKHRFPLHKGIIGRTMRLGQTHYVPDVLLDADYLLGLKDTRSELAVPIQRGESVLGVLDLQSEQKNGFTIDDILLAESLAGAVALALENAYLYSESEAHLAEISTLYAIAQTTSRSLVLDDVLIEALLSTMTSLGFTRGMVTLVDETDGHLSLVTAHNLPAPMLLLANEYGGGGVLSAYIHKHRQSLIIRDLSQDVPLELQATAEALQAMGLKSYAGLPLLHQNQSLGTMCLFNDRAHQQTNMTSGLLIAIGHQIAIAVANARLHQVVARKQNQLQTLIDASRDGLILITAEGHIVVINAAALTTLALPGQIDDWRGSAISHSLIRLRRYNPTLVKGVLAELRRIQADHHTAGEGDWELSQRLVHWLNLPVSMDEQFVGWLFVLHDVTEERMVARLREDLTQTMVHDLRNPLTAIRGAAELLHLDWEDSSTEEKFQMMNVIQRNTDKMLDLVNTIMDMSRLESHQLPLEWSAFPLHDVAREAFLLQTPLAEEKQLHLENQVSYQLPLAWADFRLTGRILQNLIGNAIKFTPMQGDVFLSAQIEAENGSDCLVVAVSDNGPGISPEVRERLFQKFATGHQKGRGSGVGLAFCRLAVEAHGGRIWVESSIEQGTVFKFTLPILRPQSTPKTFISPGRDINRID